MQIKIEKITVEKSTKICRNIDDVGLVDNLSDEIKEVM